MFLYMVLTQNRGATRSRGMAVDGQGEKPATAREEIRSYQFWKAVRCEFLVTLLYVFIGENMA